MSRRYRVLSPAGVSLPEGAYAEGDEFEHEFTADEEWDCLDTGQLELAGTSTYKVVGDAPVFDTAPGETFEAALPLAQEQLLIGSHIEAVEPEQDPEPEEPAKKERRRTAQPVKE